MNAKAHSQRENLEDKPQGLEEEIWAQFRTVLRQELKAMLEQLLEEELRQQVGAGRYEHSEDRQGYRNGHYWRRFLTRYGEFEGLAVP